MRHGKEHKDATRQRIIEAAGRRFKRDGIDGSGISTLMKDAGLTNGAFCTHFTSKDELVATAVADQLQVGTVVRTSIPDACRSHRMAIRPCGDSWVTCAQVMPPPGRGRKTMSRWPGEGGGQPGDGGVQPLGDRAEGIVVEGGHLAPVDGAVGQMLSRRSQMVVASCLSAYSQEGHSCWRSRAAGVER